MARDIQFGLRPNTNEPLDNRMVVEGTTERNNLITNDLAYEGMLVWVKSDNLYYVLRTLGTDVSSSVWDQVGGGSATVSYVRATANTTAAIDHLYSLGANSITITLPSSPDVGDEIYISNYEASEDCVLGRNGNRIMGLEEDMDLDNPHASFLLVYSGTNQGWLIIGADGGGANVGGSGTTATEEVGVKTLSSSDGTVEFFSVNVIPSGTSGLSITTPSPTAGDWFEIANLSGETDNTISRGSHLIQGNSTDLVLDDDTASFRMTFINTSTGWVITGAN